MPVSRWQGQAGHDKEKPPRVLPLLLSDQLTEVVSLPGLTGQSTDPGQLLLDRAVKPGDDSLSRASQSANASEQPHRDPMAPEIGLE
jgi:hypothetical protein